MGIPTGINGVGMGGEGNRWVVTVGGGIEIIGVFLPVSVVLASDNTV